MKNIIIKALTTLLVSSLLISTFPAFAAQNAEPHSSTEPLLIAQSVDKPGPFAMASDAVIARPLLFAATVIGSALFVVSLPFSALGGNVHEAADTLVMTPARATFKRCLGCNVAEN